MTTSPSGDLGKRVESLGRSVIRGDIGRWIRHLDVVGPTERAALAASFTDPSLVELVALVDAYGGEEVLRAVAQASAELRRGQRTP